MTKTHQTDILDALERSPSTTAELKKIIRSSNKEKEGWKDWTKKDRLFQKAMDKLVEKCKAVKVKGGKYRLPTDKEKKLFNLEKLRASVRARLASGESLEIAGGRLGAGDFSSSNVRNANHMAAVGKGGKMEATLVLKRLLAQHSEMTYARPRMYNVDPKALKLMANHSDISVASLILKNRLVTVTGIDQGTFEQVFLEWSNAKMDKTEKRRLHSLPDDLKKYKLGEAIRVLE